jgi:predicted DNA-binding protein YlxM (UPF0122 family)
MKRTRLVGHSLAGSIIVFSTVWFASAGSCASYETQMKAYHDKLLAYQVQPGRFQPQRQAVCDKLKQMTRENSNVDALWAKFDALERRAAGRDSKDPTYMNDCNAFIKEVQDRLEKHVKEFNANADAKSAASATAAKDSRNAAYQAYIDNLVKTYQPTPGPHIKRRQKIWDEIKRCHVQKKMVNNHVEQYKQMEKALSEGKDINELCKQLEYSLALPQDTSNE